MWPRCIGGICAQTYNNKPKAQHLRVIAICRRMRVNIKSHNLPCFSNSRNMFLTAASFELWSSASPMAVDTKKLGSSSSCRTKKTATLERWGRGREVLTEGNTRIHKSTQAHKHKHTINSNLVNKKWPRSRTRTRTRTQTCETTRTQICMHQRTYVQEGSVAFGLWGKFGAFIKV